MVGLVGLEPTLIPIMRVLFRRQSQYKPNKTNKVLLVGVEPTLLPYQRSGLAIIVKEQEKMGCNAGFEPV